MRFRKVLLVTPNYRKSHYRPVLATGPGYLAENLKGANILYEYCDLGFRDGHKQLQKKIKEFKPELLGISLLSYRYKDHYRLISFLKENYTDVPIIVGGPHVTMLKEKILAECPDIDWGVVLEGEKPLIDLCRGKPFSEIAGLVWRDNEKHILCNDGYSDYNYTLDNILFPKYDRFNLGRYIDKELNIIPILTSRGCSFKCNYCPVPNSLGHAFRARSANNVADEIEYWHSQGYRRFGISDDNFTFMRGRVFEICGEIEKRNFKNLMISCDNGIRVDYTDFEMLRRMREVGFWRVAFGVESGSEKVLKSINKNQQLEKVEQSISQACRLGYVVRLFFLIGSPNETVEDFKESISLAKRFPIAEASFYTLIPFPNTELYAWIRANNLFLVKDNLEYLNYASGWKNKPIFQTGYFTKRQRKWAFCYARKLNRKILRSYLKGRLKKFGLFGLLASWAYSFSIVREIFYYPGVRKAVLVFIKPMIRELLEHSHVEPVVDYIQISERPKVSVIIPSLDGLREGNLARLIEDLKNQSLHNFEIHVIKGDNRQGRAINRGAKLAKGDILVIMDDDISLGTPYLLENLVKALENTPTMGMAGVSFGIPENATPFQKRALKELPRYTFPVVDKIVESDFASHPCCAIPKHVFEEIGGENEEIIRGLDPELRVRMRRAGYKVVIVPHSWVYHLPPRTLWKFIKKFFRNGKSSAYLQICYPELVYETHTGKGRFVERRNFIYRGLRYPYRLVRALVTFQFIAFLADFSYGFGFISGYLKYGVLESIFGNDKANVKD
jgi:radical SAM superfamily enzyme YgiQ (UPF0313 family)/GT2 family glycosyltransferase